MASKIGAAPKIAPSSMQWGGSLVQNKFLWGGIVLGSMAIFFGALIYLFRKKGIFTNCTCGRPRHKDNLDAEKLRLRRFKMEELEKATNNFSRGCLVGSGAFGNVYIGTFAVQGTLAIKKAGSDSYTSIEEFRNGPKGANVLVYEYVQNGSLLEYIAGRGGKLLTWRQRENLANGDEETEEECLATNRRMANASAYRD